MKILLASQSPSRKRLLSQAGFSFEIFAPNLQEEKHLNPSRPAESCQKLAKLKALKAQEKHPESIIIACDQMAELDGKLFGKAHTEKKAIENLIQLQGKTHSLFTALCMLWGRKRFFHTAKSLLSMRGLNFQQIKNYVEKEQPLKAAGSYHLEGYGITLFEKIETDDFNNIQGLPLIRICNQLIQWGYPLWKN